MIGWLHAGIALPTDDHGAARFWAEVLGWPLGAPWPDRPEFSSFAPPTGDSFVHRQRLDGESRINPQLEVDDPEAEQRRLVALGATPVGQTPSGRTLVSPGGLPFCLVRAVLHADRPAPIGPPGRRCRLAQISIDSPAHAHDREVQFWREATGWRFAPSEHESFAGKLYPAPGAPLQLLLQRLAADDRAPAVRAHLDLGCDDREAEAARLVALGAERLWSGDGWITLRDPAGLLFCATGTSPDSP